DGDGALDLVLQSEAPAPSDAVIFLNDGAGAFSPLLNTDIPLSARSWLLAADIDGQGEIDLLSFENSAGSVRVRAARR
ncbi:MAG TPA: VCBS repeat-containing protein, partial [Polyangiaceae bacterium]|nr:VCBS repeat-containing protein [Polyangiaceae bacterium]